MSHVNRKLIDQWRAFELVKEDRKHFHPLTTGERVADRSLAITSGVLGACRTVALMGARAALRTITKLIRNYRHGRTR